MRCKQAQKLISAHLEGELSPENRELFLSHLEVCAGCRTLEEQVRETVATLRSLPETAMSPADSQCVERAWREGWRERNEVPRARSVGWARAATALGAVMILGAAAAISASVLHHPAETAESGGASETAAADLEAGNEAGHGYSGTDTPRSGVPTAAVAPQVVSNARAMAATDMAGYQADDEQKMSFYTAVWKPPVEEIPEDQTPAYDLEALGRLQRQLLEDMALAAEALGEDAQGLRHAIDTALQAAANQVPLLPCWAEKVVFEGRAAWIISLSGPAETRAADAEAAHPKETADEPPAPAGEGTGGPAYRPVLPRHLFVVDAGDFRILFR